MGSLGVGHDWVTSLSLFTFTHWRRKWQPTSVLLPGESQGWGSLVGFHLWDRTESDMTEVTYQQQQHTAQRRGLGPEMQAWSTETEDLVHRDVGMVHRDAGLAHRNEDFIHRDAGLVHWDGGLVHRDANSVHRDDSGPQTCWVSPKRCQLGPQSCTSLAGKNDPVCNLDGVDDRREVQEGGDICIPMADSYSVWRKPTILLRQLSCN